MIKMTAGRKDNAAGCWNMLFLPTQPASKWAQNAFHPCDACPFLLASGGHWFVIIKFVAVPRRISLILVGFPLWAYPLCRKSVKDWESIRCPTSWWWGEEEKVWGIRVSYLFTMDACLHWPGGIYRRELNHFKSIWSRLRSLRCILPIHQPPFSIQPNPTSGHRIGPPNSSLHFIFTTRF